jgi:serine/threonine protein kinase/Flp pilus assembly protein TadD
MISLIYWQPVMKTQTSQSQPSPRTVQPGQAAGSRPTLDDRSEVVPALFGGRYQLQGLIGAGGTGTVYRALDIELGETVALKVLRREVVSLPRVLDRFRAEVRLSRRITHRNVARMYDIGEHLGEKFLTMELIDGAPLSQVLGVEQGQPIALPISRALPIVIEICAGLQAAHEIGIIHRDLKPENVLLAKDGRVVLTDFGIARAVEQPEAEGGQAGLLGTPEYMAPEQVDGSGEITTASDIFALGVTLFEMLTGKLPFVAATPMLTAMQRLFHDPPDPRSVKPDLPAGLAELVLRCLRRDPKQRVGSASELASELQQLLSVRAAQAPAASSVSGGFLAMPTETAVSRQKSVAVLPLRNPGSADDSYLAEGLTEELIDALSMVKGVRVRSRGVSMSIQGDLRDARTLGKELGVQLVIDGTLRRLGDALRLTVRLINVDDGFQVWAQRFDSKVAELFSLSDAVTAALAQALTSQLGQAPERAKLTDAQAVEKYFKARQLYHGSSSGNMADCVALFEEVLVGREGDPKLLVGYALAQARHWFFGNAEAADKARAAAEQALQAAPNSGESYLAVAVVKFQDADLAGAVVAVRQALIRSPILAEAHDLMGRILIETGPLQEGLRAMAIALDIDPSLQRLKTEQARLYELQGQHKKCDELLGPASRSSIGGSYATALRVRICLWRRDPDYARALLREIEAGLQVFQNSQLIVESVATGRPIDIEKLMSGVPLGRTGSQRGQTLFQQLSVEWSSYQGNLQKALRSLAMAVDFGLIDLLWLDYCPLLRPLASDPQFQALRRIVEGRAKKVQAALIQPLS